MIHQIEILENILVRLPAKSIGRLRCVSKSWKSLLSQPQFIKTHLNRIKQVPREEESLILFSEKSGFYYSVQLKYAHQGLDELTAFATKLNFDDLILDSDFIFDDKMAYCDALVVVDEGDKLLLMNPTTSEIKEVPASPYAINPDHDCTMFGLGYDLLTDDYKVVTLSCFDDSYESQSDVSDDDDHSKMFVDVYSVKNGIWKRTEHSQYQHFDNNDEHIAPGVFIEGRIHWLVTTSSGSSFVIVAFDVEKEEYYEMPPPTFVDLDDEFEFTECLVALGGCLCMSHITSRGDTDIWVMKEFGVEASWTKFATIDSQSSELRPLCLLGKEQLVLVKDDHEDDLAKLVMYNKEEGSLKDIVVQGIPDEFGLYETFGRTFLESLVSPHCNNEASKEKEDDHPKKEKLYSSSKTLNDDACDLFIEETYLKEYRTKHPYKGLPRDLSYAAQKKWGSMPYSEQLQYLDKARAKRAEQRKVFRKLLSGELD